MITYYVAKILQQKYLLCHGLTFFKVRQDLYLHTTTKKGFKIFKDKQKDEAGSLRYLLHEADYKPAAI